MVRKYINILRDNHQIKNNESENNEYNEKHLKTYNLSVKNLCNAKYNKDLLWLVAILKKILIFVKYWGLKLLTHQHLGYPLSNLPHYL